MDSRTTIAAGLLLLLLAVVTVGCEDSDVVAPSGSVITIFANPADVFIDQDGGDTEGQTTLIAKVVDGSGFANHPWRKTRSTT